MKQAMPEIIHQSPGCMQGLLRTDDDADNLKLRLKFKEITKMNVTMKK